jgi:regulator of protease activity HflC (stomatin/prohibitin superfamily)
MFWWLIGPLILLIIALIALVVSRVQSVTMERMAANSEGETKKYKEERALRTGARWVAGVCLGLILFMEILSSFAIVGTKEVGVITTFGKPVGELSNGIHLVLPWQEVTELDAAIQTDSVVDDRKSQECTSASVRLANQSTACVDDSIRWRIKPEAADELFRDYRSFDNIRDSLVTRELNSALNSVMSHFNPLSTLINSTQNTETESTEGGEEERAEINLPTLAKEVQEKMQTEIGSQIEVLSVIIPFAGYDQKTQEKINLFQAALANTKIATQEEKTALHEANANRNLAASVSHDPNVLVSKCLSVLDNMVKDKRPVPAGFSCWPGGGSAIVVPSASR